MSFPNESTTHPDDAGTELRAGLSPGKLRAFENDETR